MISPIIRYIGSKSAAMSQILEKFPLDIQEYREPFIGGGSVLLGMLQHRSKPSTIQIGDIDHNISNMWDSIINSPDKLVEQLRERPREFSLTQELTGAEAASQYIINNLFKQFVNWGSLLTTVDANKKIVRFENEYKAKVYGISNIANGTIVRNESYELAFEDCKNKEKTLVFLDPPYKEVSRNNEYYEYNQTTFDYDLRCK